MRWRALTSLAKTIRKDWRFWRAVYRHDRTPWLAKAMLWLAIAYILLPFDLVPDFIPLLGQLDDVIIVAGLVTLARLLVPREVMRQCRRQCSTDGTPELEDAP